MVRLRLFALMLVGALALAVPAYAASPVDGFPVVPVYPLPDPGVTTENMWITQGGTDYRITPTKAGYIFQGTCSTLTAPYLHQLCWNTAATPAQLQAYDGSTWITVYSVDAINHLLVPPIGGGALPTVASATTTNLCGTSSPQAVLYVSGTATITSFGSTCPQGSSKIIIWTSTPTITYNASSMILPGAASITPHAGDVWWVTALGSGNWQLFFDQPAASFSGVTTFNGRSGVVVPATNDYAFSNISGVATNAQLPTTGAVGSTVNLSGTLGGANTSVAITADSIVTATSLTGTTYVLGNYNETFNSATTGAGGMDLAPLPSSGNVCIYAIYKPTTATTSILGVNCTTSSSTIYAGAHMPSGYTASAFLAKWPTNGTPAMVAGTYASSLQQSGNVLILGGALITTGSGPATLAFPSSTATFTLPAVTDTLGGLGTAETWTAVQTFTNSTIKLLGSSTGKTTVTSANAGASNFTLTVPSANTTIPIAAQTLTFTGPTNARSFTLPDQNATFAVVDNVTQTFAGSTTFSAAVVQLTATPSSAGTDYVCINLGTSSLLSHFTANCGVSDERLKTNWNDALPGLGAMMRLHPGTFDWRDQKRATAGRQIGFRAQEIRAIIPELTSVGGDTTIQLADGTEKVIHDTESLDYAKLTVALVKWLQDEHAIVGALRTQILFMWLLIVALVIAVGDLYRRDRAR